MAQLLSVNVGLPREVTWNGRTVRTTVWKVPAEGRRVARKLNLDGDAQADLAGHGGEQRAVASADAFRRKPDRRWPIFRRQTALQRLSKAPSMRATILISG